MFYSRLNLEVCFSCLYPFGNCYLYLNDYIDIFSLSFLIDTKNTLFGEFYLR